ncbi:isoafricanol synthase [Streptomyces sp. RKCA744]|uniref:isoafricanol synthase n=1 Tax=Streptomyces sp. RKCA744 TaxID=2959340 RepID=UPI0020A0E70F|nr:isoafricanol synthase [Streptomyces sp. RKCA744]MCO8305707.1 pentalenene synthase [Streptomyces sp. RKCA744]
MHTHASRPHTRRTALLRRAALFDFPASTDLSPGTEAARHHTIQWLSRFGVFEDRASVAEYDALRFDVLAGLFYPRASGAELDLGNDLVGWYFVFDDQFDGELGCRPEAVARLVAAVVRITEEDEEHGRAGSGDGPLLESFRDLWRRINSGRPRVWRDRFRHHWLEYLHSYHREALERTGTLPRAGGEDGTGGEAGAPRSVEAVLALRRHSIGVQPCLDLNEPFGGYTLPPALHGGFPLARMREATDDVVVFTNDIASLDKELAVGDVHNSVIVQWERAGGELEDAVRHIADLANARYRWFEETAARLPALLTEAGADPDTHHAVARYVDGMRYVMTGNLGWSLRTARYDERGTEAVSGGRQRPWAQLTGAQEPVRAGRGAALPSHSSGSRPR